MIQFFGGSIFPEEYRGNFPEIKRRLDVLQAEADTETDLQSDNHAKCLLLQGIFALLTGDNAKAIGCLTGLGDRSRGFSSEWRARSLSYLALLIAWSRRPAPFRFQTELGGFSGNLHDIQTKYSENASSVERMMADLSGSGSQVDAYERSIIRFLSTLTMKMQTSGHSSHPFFPQAFRMQSEIDQSGWYSLLTNQKAWATILGFPALSRYFGRLELEFKIARCDSDVEEALRSLEEEYENVQDLVGLASIYVLNADRMLSPPFSSPLALNLIATDGSSATIKNSQWDIVEAGMSLNDNSDSQVCHKKALELYRRSKAPRGCAAVKLREACIQHAAALREVVKSSAWSRLIEDAKSNLEEAEHLFEMDVYHQLLVRAHKIMLSISSGDIHDVIHQAHDLGTIALQTQNLMMAQYAGLLIMKYGQRRWNDQSDSHPAFLSFECARACFTATQNQYLVFTTLTTQLELSTTLSYHSKSRALADQTVLSFRKLLSFLNDVSRNHPAQRTVPLVISGIVTAVGPMISRAYYYSNDTAALISWFEEISALDAVASSKIAPRLDSTAITRYMDQHGRENESFLSMNTQRQIGNRKFHEYYLAEIKAQNALQQFDIVTAESALQDLLRDHFSHTPDVSGRIGAAEMIAIYTCYRLGLPERARHLLDAIPISKLLQGIVSKSISTKYNWSSDISGTFLWDFAIAENALGVCIMAQDWKKVRAFLDRNFSSFLLFRGTKRSSRDITCNAMTT